MLSESAWVRGRTAGVILSMWAGDALLALSPVQPGAAARESSGARWRSSPLGVLITVVIGLSPPRSMGTQSLAQDLRKVRSKRAASVAARCAIVAAQIAVTVTLLVGAALFGRSFAALAKFDPGFEPEGVLAMRVQLPVVAGAQAAPPAEGQVVDAGAASLALLEDLRGLPGVTHAALASAIPLGGQGAIFYSAEGMGAVDATTARARIASRLAGYVETIGLRLNEGACSAPPTGANATNVMVTQSMAERFWPGQSGSGAPVGDPTGENLDDRSALKDANLRGIPVVRRKPDIFLLFKTRAVAVLIKASTDPSSLIKPAADGCGADAGVAVFTPQRLSVDQ